MMSHRFTLIALSALLALAGLIPGTTRADAQSDCTFTVGTDVPLYAAPLADATQITGILPPGSYPVISRSGLTYDALYYVQVDDAFGNWVEPQTGTVSGSCDSLPLDERPLTDYPSICTLTTDQALAFYNDAALSTPKPFDLEPGQYVVTQAAGQAYHVRLDHAMGGWVPKGDGGLSPACALVINDPAVTALTEANARLWSAPTVRTGEILYTLPEGVTVTIIAGPVRGPIRYDSDLEGVWYHVAQNDMLAGWIWAERLTLIDAPPPPPEPHQTGTALANARLWSLPDVRSGSQLASLPPGTQLYVLEGPVTGPIRFDTDDTGDWYRVQVVGRGVTGWLWTGRIALD